MLCRWIINAGQILKQQKWNGFLKYYSSTAVECILRSELRSTKEATAKLLERNKCLLKIKPDEMKKSFRRLKRLNFSICDIRTHPTVLLQSDFELLNNFQRLHEIGFSEVTVYRLANIRNILSKSVHFNQCFNFLPKNINIIEHIYMVAKVPFETDDDNTQYDNEIQLSEIHRMALRSYMINCIGYTSSCVDEIWNNWPFLKVRSLQSLVESRQLLENIYKIPTNQLPKHIFSMHPEEIEELLVADNVSGIDVRNIMTIGPKCNLTRIKEIQMICEAHKVPQYALAFSPKLFFMNVDTLKSRLNQIRKLKQGNEFLQHISIGKVILSMGRLKLYTKSEKMRFNSVFNHTFVNFFLNGYLLQQSHPPLFYLCMIFNKSRAEIEEALQIHPHWKDNSFPVVHQNINYLINQGFTYDDIFTYLPIVLYSRDEIKEFFDQLKDPIETEKLNIKPKEVSNLQILRLCVYHIEKKCGFNGEGIFLNSHTIKFNDDERWQMEEIIKHIRN